MDEDIEFERLIEDKRHKEIVSVMNQVVNAIKSDEVSDKKLTEDVIIPLDNLK